MTSALARWASDEDVAAASELPCDFVAFLAERQRITTEQDEALLVSWLATYERTRQHHGVIGS